VIGVCVLCSIVSARIYRWNRVGAGRGSAAQRALQAPADVAVAISGSAWFCLKYRDVFRELGRRKRRPSSLRLKATIDDRVRGEEDPPGGVQEP
jgi:hypothetical protein